MKLGDKLGAFVDGASWRDLSEFLDALDEVELKEARAWYRQGRGQARRAAEQSFGPSNAHESGAACVQLLALRLAPTAQKAAEWFGWNLVGEFGEVAEPLVLRKLAARGREWCAEFVQTAGAMTFRGESASHAERVVRYGMPLVAHFGLPLPSGPAYVEGWAYYYALLRFRVAGARERPGGGFSAQTWLTSSGNGVQGADPDPPTLVDAWRRDPVLAEAFAACLATPGLIGHGVAPVVQGWEVGPAVATLIAEGRLDRDRVLADCLAALTRQETPAAAKAIASILAAVEVGPADLRDRIPLVQGVMATAPGAVTAVLLLPLIEAISGAAFEELATTVFSRKEKKQQSVLLKTMLAKDAVERFGREVVVAVLSKAAEVPDESTASRARARLESLGAGAGPAPVVSLEGLWGDVPAIEVGRFARIAPEPAGIAAELTQLEVGGDAGSQARYLDALVRWAWSDVEVVKRWFRENGAGYPTDLTLERTMAWASGTLTGKSFAAYAELVGAYHGGGKRSFDGADWVLAEMPVTAAFADLHLQECLLNAGRVPHLLSTPSRADGVLEFDDLVARIHGYRSVECGPLDLFQALLRLEDVAPDRLVALSDVVLPIWRPAADRGLVGRLRGKEPPDAVAVIRQWVEGGGLPSTVAVTADGMTSIQAVELPVELFPEVPLDLVAGYRAIHSWPGIWFDPARTIGVVPRWPDLVAARMQETFLNDNKWGPPWLDRLVGPGAGPAVHHLLAMTITHPDESCRLLGVDALLVLIGRGGFDPAVFIELVLDRFARGSLPLARVSAAFEQAILGGGLKGLWPTMGALVETACSMAKTPAGLAELLSVVRRYLPAVPDPVLPSAVRELASSKGSTKARVEARALVALADELVGR